MGTTRKVSELQFILLLLLWGVYRLVRRVQILPLFKNHRTAKPVTL